MTKVAGGGAVQAYVDTFLQSEIAHSLIKV